MVLIVSFSAIYSKAYAAPQKTVYVVINVDTESISGKYLGQTSRGPYLTMDLSLYSSSPPSTFNSVFNQTFRNSVTDSFGNNFKMTWFTEMDYLYSQSTFVNGTAPAGVSGYTAMLDLLQKNWGSQMQTFGDVIEYHHHFEIYNGVWTEYGNGPDGGYGDYQNYALDHMIIDNGFYPSCFRSGWNIMSPALSTWVEQWFPFDYCPRTGGWSPVQAPGMKHWQTQTLFLTYYNQVQQAFVEARDHGSSIYSFYMHSWDNMVRNITDLSSSLKSLASDQITYPGVKYEFVTAAQAMQLALGFTDVTKPTFQVYRNGSTYFIESSEALWNNNLYVAVSRNDGSYSHLTTLSAGANKWTVLVPAVSSVSKIGVAANDLYGNPGLSVFSPTPTPTPTPTPAPTASPTPTSTPTPTPSPTPVPTSSPTPTATPTPFPTPTPTPVPTSSPTPTATPTPFPTPTPTPVPTSSPTPTATPTPFPTPTPTPVPTSSPTPTTVPTPSFSTPADTSSPSPAPSVSSSPNPTLTVSPSSSMAPTVSPSPLITTEGLSGTAISIFGAIAIVVAVKVILIIRKRKLEV